MLKWLITSLAMTGIGETLKTLDKRKSKTELVQHRQFVSTFASSSKPFVRYQNKGKQMMYEVYLKDLEENPDWAAFKVKHGGYGGYVFDDTEK